MASTVESLKHVRRIVLTDYVSGVKMLDLERSVLAEQQPDAAVTNAAGARPRRPVRANDANQAHPNLKGCWRRNSARSSGCGGWRARGAVGRAAE